MVAGPAPRQVKRRDTKGAKGRTKAETAAIAGKSLGGAFWLISLRAGEHWQLEEHEKRELGEKLAAALATLPAGKLPPWLAELVRVAESCAPWVAFGTAAVAVAVPRVMLTKMQQEQAAHAARDAAQSDDAARVVGTIQPQTETA